MSADYDFHNCDEFTKAFIVALLWSEMDDDSEPIDQKYTHEDLSDSAWAEIKEDCQAFQNDNQDMFDGEYERAGTDFCLTRNGHGAGFWDGDWSEDIGRKLTDASKVYGTLGLYVGDDGKLYTHN